jgi:hypothetical protein
MERNRLAPSSIKCSSKIMQRVSFGYHISITTVLQKYYLDINPKAISGDEEIEESSSISVEADMD